MMNLMILDIGSGNSCKNNIDYIRKIVDEFIKYDQKKFDIVFKFQLWTRLNKIVSSENRMLNWLIFYKAYEYIRNLGYKVTASVFDVGSLNYLASNFNIPFVKLANNKKLEYLIKLIPRNIIIVYSNNEFNKDDDLFTKNDKKLFCVSEYPCSIDNYADFNFYEYDGISDHSKGIEIFKKYPHIIMDINILEKHIKLPKTTGLDAGSFAITPYQFKELQKYV